MRTPTRALVATAAIALALLASSCGSDTSNSVARDAGRTISVTMTDNAFRPADLQVSAGETVTFLFENDGSVEHEAILGDDAAQMAHHAEMTAATAPMDEGGMHHGGETAEDDGAITVEPGRTGALTHTFTETGTILIGCHEPGHWEAGMKAEVAIS